MVRFFKKAIHDIRENGFLNTITIVTIALSVLIVSAYFLFFKNASDILNAWQKGIRIMAYLEPGVAHGDLEALKQQISTLYGVQQVRFISKNDALAHLRQQMKRQASILGNLEENPLPDAFEIRMIPSSQRIDKVEILAAQVESLPGIDEVEYGQSWIARFQNVFSLFELVGYTMGGLFFMATVFIVANTIRLVLYSRREEVEIMRLVGATDRFIKTPFYIEGLILGALGGIIGLGVLFLIYLLVSSNMGQDLSAGFITIRFLTPITLLTILFTSAVVGWLGCYLSLKQFLSA